jgi:hypothetical protein
VTVLSPWWAVTTARTMDTPSSAPPSVAVRVPSPRFQQPVDGGGLGNRPDAALPIAALTRLPT